MNRKDQTTLMEKLRLLPKEQQLEILDGINSAASETLKKSERGTAEHFVALFAKNKVLEDMVSLYKDKD